MTRHNHLKQSHGSFSNGIDLRLNTFSGKNLTDTRDYHWHPFHNADPQMWRYLQNNAIILIVKELHFLKKKKK